MRRGVVAGLIGLALVAGSTGCSKVGEKIAEEAVERNSNCTNVDIDASEGGFSGTCDGDDIDLSATGNGEVPAAWPTDLAPPAELNVLGGTDTAGPPQVLNVTGTMDGEVTAVYDAVKTQLTNAGYTIDSDVPDAGGLGGGVLAATGPEWTAAVTVTGNPSGIGGNVAITYTLTAL